MYMGITAVVIKSSNARPSRQWKYLELDSKTPMISNMINSNMVMDKANVDEKINWTDMWRIS